MEKFNQNMGHSFGFRPVRKSAIISLLLSFFFVGWFGNSGMLSASNNDHAANQPVPSARLSNKDYATLLLRDGWPVGLLNTAAEAAYLSDEEKNMVLAMNLIRYDPPKYAELYVKSTLNYFRNKEYHYPDLDIIFLTREGNAPVVELYEQLKNTAPLPVFKPSEGLSRASRSHAQYQGKTGELGHDGQGGMRARIEREGRWLNRIAENIAYGNLSAHHAILSLMVDDGVPGRGHRVNMLNPAFLVVGTAWAVHPRYPGGVYVINYAGGFE